MMRDEKGRFPSGVCGNPNGRPYKYEYENGSKESRRNAKLLNKYGITLSQYNEIFEKQCGVCALCGKPETKAQVRVRGGIVITDMLHVDHDHETGRVRGLLCYRCNTGIGKLYDDPGLLRKAADYLDGKPV